MRCCWTWTSPRCNAPAPAPPDGSRLVHSVKLGVRASSCRLTLEASSTQVQLQLSRQQAHSLLDALACAVHQSGWLQTDGVPEWLGHADITPSPLQD